MICLAGQTRLPNEVLLLRLYNIQGFTIEVTRGFTIEVR